MCHVGIWDKTMFKKQKTTSLMQRLLNNEDGNMALTFALSLTVMVGLAGSAIDFTAASNAQKRSQSIADATALSAAIFVKNNDRAPKNQQEGYMDGQEYTALDLGYDFKGWVDGGAANVKVKVNYDDNAKEAVVTVSGQTIPTLMQVVGKDRLDFSAESVVSYMEVDEKFPASITLVLDNSGSMAWDDKFAEADGSSPSNAKARIDGLTTSVKQFKRDLKRRLGTQNNAIYRTIRMGMIPYSSNIIDDDVVNMKWGYIGNAKINAMEPYGATNSNPPMSEAKGWLDDEDLKHENEANRMGEAVKEPLKFVIFMTDGQNTVGNFEFIADDESNRYYAFKSLFGRAPQWWYSGNQAYDSDFQEGWLRRDSDRMTIETCEEMHEDNIQVFAIGYALEVGHYNSNDEDDPNKTSEVTASTHAAANALLSACASKPENYIMANNAEDLKSAFDGIQNAIVEELIRIKS
jgi:Flp pilus assembly protein TadG